MEGEERKLVEEKLARIYLKKLIHFRHFSFSFHLLFSHLYPNIGLNFKFYFMFEIYSFLLIYINKEFNNLILNLKWNCNSFFLLFNFFYLLVNQSHSTFQIATDPSDKEDSSTIFFLTNVLI